MTATRLGLIDVMKMLLEKGAAVNAREKKFGQTALMFARLFGRREVADLLEHAGADRARLDAAGRSAEDWARTQAPGSPVASVHPTD